VTHISNIIHVVSSAPSPSSWSHLTASVRFSLPCPPHMPLACVLREISTPQSSLSSSFTRSAYSPHCPLSCTIAVALARSSSSSRSGLSEHRSTSSLPGTTASPDSSSTSTARKWLPAGSQAHSEAAVPLPFVLPSVVPVGGDLAGA
jgi:hypothetical protein